MTAKPRIIATTHELTSAQMEARTPSSMARVNSDYSMGYEDPRYSNSPNPFSSKVRVIFPFSGHPKDSFLGDYLDHATVRRLSKSSTVRVDFQLPSAPDQVPALLPQCEPLTFRTEPMDSHGFSDFLRWWLDSENSSSSQENLKNDSSGNDDSSNSSSCVISPAASPKNSRSGLYSTYFLGKVGITNENRENQGSPTFTCSSFPAAGFLHDPRQSVVRRLMLELPSVIQDDGTAAAVATRNLNSSRSIENLSFCSPLHGRRPQYCVGTRCKHVDHWKRLRAKKGQIYYICKVCASKWRVPTRNTLMSKVLQEHHIQTQKELREQQQQHF